MNDLSFGIFFCSTEPYDIFHNERDLSVCRPLILRGSHSAYIGPSDLDPLVDVVVGGETGSADTCVGGHVWYVGGVVWYYISGLFFLILKPKTALKIPEKSVKSPIYVDVTLIGNCPIFLCYPLNLCPPFI